MENWLVRWAVCAQTNECMSKWESMRTSWTNNSCSKTFDCVHMGHLFFYMIITSIYRLIRCAHSILFWWCNHQSRFIYLHFGSIFWFSFLSYSFICYIERKSRNCVIFPHTQSKFQSHNGSNWITWADIQQSRSKKLKKNMI